MMMFWSETLHLGLILGGGARVHRILCIAEDLKKLTIAKLFLLTHLV